MHVQTNPTNINPGQEFAKCKMVQQNNAVRLLAWNIQGISDNVLNDSSFNYTIENSDICILTETWLEDKICVRPDIFYTFNRLRPRLSKKGRPSGGISVLIRKEFHHGRKKAISVVKESEYSVWIKICKTYFKLDKDIYVGGVYLPPEKSTFYMTKQDDPWGIIENEVMQFQNVGEVVMLGDFNARTGDLKDFVSKMGPDIEVVGNYSTPDISVLDRLGRKERQNNDSTKNSFGKTLIELCKNADLRILNGRTIGDLQGAFTSFQYNGRSVVDYCIVPERLMPVFKCFIVSPPSHLSDHASIKTNVEFDTAMGRDGVVDPGHYMSPKVWKKWDSKSKTQFQNALQHERIKQMNQSIKERYQLGELNNPTAYAEGLTKIIGSAAEMSLQLRTTNRKRNGNKAKGRGNKLGFDTECRVLKNKVLSLANNVQRYPKDPIIYGTFVRTKKRFKKIVKEKNRQAKEKILNQLSECQEKDPETYWSLLKKLQNRKAKENPISLEEWETYFKKLHNESLVENKDEAFIQGVLHKIETQINRQDSSIMLERPFTMKEIVDAISKLKNNKAVGPDAVMNEMLKAGCNDLSRHIQNLFNLILSTEETPRQWSTGYIIPVYKAGCEQDKSNYRGISITSCLGKLFGLIINNRLTDFLNDTNVLCKEQIGFQKGKRTSDHIFTLKCIIEEAKSKKKPVYGCFVDLKKAYDTVWRSGLYYKLLHYYKVSPKLVRIIQNMYSELKGRVKLNNHIGNEFEIGIGLRQGCNMSPSLFNLYINDLPAILREVNTDPVNLNTSKINVLLYADDMLILSNSERGLQNALDALQLYCNKWQLVVNTEKTQVMVFNKQQRNQVFKFNDKALKITNEYIYLGVKIHQSGTFTAAIKDLANRANKAMFKIKSLLKDSAVKPKLPIRLFDVMVKPICLYCSEVWGGFGIKLKRQNNLLEWCLQNDSTPYEQLNIKTSKVSLGLPRRASNIGSKAELGRMPLIKSIIVAMLKYHLRLRLMAKGEIVAQALESQKQLRKNSNETMTFETVVNQLLDQLKVPVIQTQGIQNKERLVRDYGAAVKEKCVNVYKELIHHVLEKINVKESKLNIYVMLKRGYMYEAYLDTHHRHRDQVTKFRLSCHWLPIERGRYMKPQIPRQERVCVLCKEGIGNEMHALMKCNNGQLAQCRQTYGSQITSADPQFGQLSDAFKLIYLLKGDNLHTIKFICDWLNCCNKVYKEWYMSKHKS